MVVLQESKVALGGAHSSPIWVQSCHLLLVAGQRDGSPICSVGHPVNGPSSDAAGQQGGPSGRPQHVQQPRGQPCHATWGWGAPDGPCAVNRPGAER